MMPWWIPRRAWFVAVLTAATLWGIVVYLTEVSVLTALIFGIPVGYLAAKAAAPT